VPPASPPRRRPRLPPRWFWAGSGQRRTQNPASRSTAAVCRRRHRRTRLLPRCARRLLEVGAALQGRKLLRSHRRPSAVSCALCYATVIRWRLRAARLRAARLRVAQLLRAGWRSRAAPEPERRRLARGGGAQGKPRRRVIGTTAPVPAIPPPSPRRSTPPALHPPRPHARAA